MNLRGALQLYFVMGSTNCNVDPVFVLQEAIIGGVTMFQFREKDKGALIGNDKVQLAKKLQAVCKENDIPFIVNDDIELALLVDADGVHIGQEDEDILLVRERIGRYKILGLSCHNLQEARVAVENGADYIGVGPMYPTISKLDTRNVVGPTLISQLREASIQIPIVGIGGITAANSSHVLKAGADGVAVISAISKMDSPKLAAEKILQSI